MARIIRTLSRSDMLPEGALADTIGLAALSVLFAALFGGLVLL